MKNTKQHAGVMASIEMTSQRPVKERGENRNKEIYMLSKQSLYDSKIIYIKKNSQNN